MEIDHNEIAGAIVDAVRSASVSDDALYDTIAKILEDNKGAFISNDEIQHLGYEIMNRIQGVIGSVRWGNPELLDKIRTGSRLKPLGHFVDVVPRWVSFDREGRDGPMQMAIGFHNSARYGKRIAVMLAEQPRLIVMFDYIATARGEVIFKSGETVVREDILPPVSVCQRLRLISFQPAAL